ncbi:uncharacterized protein LOC135167687 isoform X2 [Diachasmimorpha longicaudata]|uniref:uncharacterized protein LOC135167687 isoform X2 n=1 Tax=Diachasmimorpha longicaudata TaxID=58733 RepID=UPI0030B8DE1D
MMKSFCLNLSSEYKEKKYRKGVNNPAHRPAAKFTFFPLVFNFDVSLCTLHHHHHYHLPFTSNTPRDRPTPKKTQDDSWALCQNLCQISTYRT